MSETGKRIFATAGISSSLDTVLATTLGTNYGNRLGYKKSNNNLLSEKSLSNNSSKSSSGSSLTLTNNNNNNNSPNNTNNGVSSVQFPHHQFYSSQVSQVSGISTSANWNNNLNIRSNSLCSQSKVNLWHSTAPTPASYSLLFSNRSLKNQFIDFNCLRKRAKLYYRQHYDVVLIACRDSRKKLHTDKSTNFTIECEFWLKKK